MPQDGLFFRVLRRFNIIWIALLGVLLVVGCGYQAWKSPFIHHELLGKYAAPSVSLASMPGSAANEPWLYPDNYGSFETAYGPWDGRIFVLMQSTPLPDVSAPDAYEGYVPNQAVNVMVLDSKNSEGTWLFPTNKQVINSRDAVFEGAAKVNSQPATEQRPAIGMVMFVTDSDTNKDGKLNAKDATSVYVWIKGTTGATKLLSAEKVLFGNQAGADRYMILFKKGKETHAVTYAIPDFKQLSDKRMPDAPH